MAPPMDPMLAPSPPRSFARLAARVGVFVGALVLGAASAADAVLVAGGGSARTDCLAQFDADANVPAKRPRNAICADGDPCDADGMVNGQCAFRVAICVNTTGDPRCTLEGVEGVHVRDAADDGSPDFDPEFQALQARVDAALELPTHVVDQCTLSTVITVPVRGPFARGRCLKSRKTLRVETLSTLQNGRSLVDVDKMRFQCEPAAIGCAPRALFTGTFDRVQRQVFDQSCALSGCHDSQSKQAELLLEAGGSLSSLVNVVPSNGVAAAAGWFRVAVTSPGVGDPATSLLVRKVTGNLGAGLGKRMPFNRPALDPHLTDLVTRWVAAGAPDTGWVPGTD